MLAVGNMVKDELEFVGTSEVASVGDTVLGECVALPEVGSEVIV